MSSAGFIISASPLYRRVAPEAVLPKKSLSGNSDLTQEQKSQISELKARDREVRAHEQAHKNVGGRYVGAVTYDYVRGPDGHRYVISGEVPIDASPVEGDLEATITKMEIIRAAALAPAEPSAQDRAIAQLAQVRLLSALSQLRASPMQEIDALDKARAIPIEKPAAKMSSSVLPPEPKEPFARPEGNAYAVLATYVNKRPSPDFSFFA